VLANRTSGAIAPPNVFVLVANRLARANRAPPAEALQRVFRPLVALIWTPAKQHGVAPTHPAPALGVRDAFPTGTGGSFARKSPWELAPGSSRVHFCTFQGTKSQLAGYLPRVSRRGSSCCVGVASHSRCRGRISPTGHCGRGARRGRLRDGHPVLCRGGADVVQGRQQELQGARHRR